ncbi:RDD family protein [Arthrobacter sp. 35/47]|uniref:RDD family protein n=1 Tax=Arthrobacter sp. 35/47 TaxID=269454 RepID=UPI00047B2D4F|nr:RDD family protein [Arthrobacter sp. 35/47]
MNSSTEQKPLPARRGGRFADGTPYVEATGGQRMGKYALDVVVILALFVVLFFVLAIALDAAGVSSESGAGIALPSAYALSALGYGFIAGFSRTLGAKAAGVRNLRYRDGRPMGPFQSAWRTLLLALFWPVILIVMLGSLFSGSPGFAPNISRARHYVVADVRSR